MGIVQLLPALDCLVVIGYPIPHKLIVLIGRGGGGKSLLAALQEAVFGMIRREMPPFSL